jgi:hypothetical protein
VNGRLSDTLDSLRAAVLDEPEDGDVLAVDHLEEAFKVEMEDVCNNDDSVLPLAPASKKLPRLVGFTPKAAIGHCEDAAVHLG